MWTQQQTAQEKILSWWECISYIKEEFERQSFNLPNGFAERIIEILDPKIINEIESFRNFVTFLVFTLVHGLSETEKRPVLLGVELSKLASKILEDRAMFANFISIMMAFWLEAFPIWEPSLGKTANNHLIPTQKWESLHQDWMNKCNSKIVTEIRDFENALFPKDKSGKPRYLVYTPKLIVFLQEQDISNFKDFLIYLSKNNNTAVFLLKFKWVSQGMLAFLYFFLQDKIRKWSNVIQSRKISIFLMNTLDKISWDGEFDYGRNLVTNAYKTYISWESQKNNIWHQDEEVYTPSLWVTIAQFFKDKPQWTRVKNILVDKKFTTIWDFLRYMNNSKNTIAQMMKWKNFGVSSLMQLYICLQTLDSNAEAQAACVKIEEYIQKWDDKMKELFHASFFQNKTQQPDILNDDL